MENEEELNVDQGIVGEEQKSKENSHYNLQDDLDAIGAAFAGNFESNPNARNSDEAFGFDSFLNAELEEILCQEDHAMYNGEPKKVIEENPVEQLRWFPLKKQDGKF